MTDSNSNADKVPSKEKFNFWRFIRLCSLKDFNALKDEQSQAFTELNSRLTVLEEKLDNKTREVQKSVAGLSQTFNSGLDEAVHIIGIQINETKSDLVNRLEEQSKLLQGFESNIRQQLSELITANEQLSKTLSSVAESLDQIKSSMLDEIKDVKTSNQDAAKQINAASESVKQYQSQLDAQTEIFAETGKMCAELMQTVRILALNSLSGQIEVLLPEDTSENASSQAQPSNPKKKRK